MACYRIYLRDTDEEIVSHGNVDCDTDRQAWTIAESLIEPGEQAEVWDGLRRVQLIGLSMASDRHRSVN